jgi:hypothetical protein
MAVMVADAPEAVATSTVGKGGSSATVKQIVCEVPVLPEVSVA